MDQMPRPLLDDSLENRLDELLLRASKDALSGLLNRATTQSHVGLRLRDMDEGASCALFIFDLDSFKAINDTLGHQAGDEAIEEDCRTVLRDLVSIDREVTAMNGRFYTLRIAPYRTTENSIRGLVLTIIDSLGKPQEVEGGEQRR